MKLLVPNTLLQNRYLIVHLIGKGGMGEVYLAIDQRLGNAVALKRTSFSDEETLLNAFEREARTLARLRHPVLPKVSDHFVENDTQYLVMEHIAGEDLAERLTTNKKPFPLTWVMFWADQLLDALDYLHSHEPPIIHRDIKPQNLKLTAENHIVLLDFGLSKNNTGETKVTTYGSIVGYTPHYAPMEQIRGTGTDARSDIYSLSATLFQLLTNVVPPDSLNRADVLLNDSPDPVKLICEINPEVSRKISEIIYRGMAVSQEKRFSGAREMQKALRDAHNRGNDSENLIETQKDKAAFGKLDELTNFGTNLQNGKAELSFENVAAGASYPPHKNIDSRTFIAPAAPESKKTKNFFAITGGLSALLIFAVGAAGFAWFATSKENNQTQSVNSLPPANTANMANTLPAPPAPVQKANINSTSTEESGIISMEPEWNQTAERLNEKANESFSGKRKSVPTIKQAAAEASAPKPVSRNNAGKVPGPTPQPSPKKTPKSQRTEILQ